MNQLTAGNCLNAKKIKDKCEICKKRAATEVHHLKHQNLANNDNSYIETFHKNHVANLINICHECHDMIHATGEQHKIVKTSDGYTWKFLYSVGALRENKFQASNYIPVTKVL